MPHENEPTEGDKPPAQKLTERTPPTEKEKERDRQRELEQERELKELQEKARDRKKVDRTEADDAKTLEDLLALGNAPKTAKPVEVVTVVPKGAATATLTLQEGEEDLEAWLDTVI